MKTLIQLQQDYIDTVSAGIDRWSIGGHYDRIRRGAWRRAYTRLIKWGYTDAAARQIIRDAHDVMLLERAAVDDPLNHATD